MFYIEEHDKSSINRKKLIKYHEIRRKQTLGRELKPI